jgi:hypothetical protein
MPIRTLLVVVAAAAAAAAACRGAPPAPNPILANVAADSAARAAMAHYVSLLDGAPPNADSIAALFAPGGELLPAGQEPIRGPNGVRAFLATFGNVRVDSCAMPVTSSTVAGNRVVLWGDFSQRATLENGQILRPRGRYVAEWIRGVDGMWRIQRMLAQAAPQQQ